MAYDRVVVVTGAASGIGAAIVRRIAGPGAALVIHTRKNADGLATVAEGARKAGAEVATVTGDLADAAVPVALIDTARAKFGRVDQIVSNAGQASRGRFGAIGPGDLEAAFAAMPIAFVRMIEAALPDLQASAWGRVVVVSSFVAHRFGDAGLLFPATSAAKAALEALAKALAFQLAATGTTVNCVAPGFTMKDAGTHAPPPDSQRAAAEATPSGRLAAPDDIAATAAFLLSREAAHITGQVIHVDGGLTLA